MKNENAKEKRIQDVQMKEMEDDKLDEVAGGGAGMRPRTCPECGVIIPLMESTCRHCGWPHLG